MNLSSSLESHEFVSMQITKKSCNLIGYLTPSSSCRLKALELKIINL